RYSPRHHPLFLCNNTPTSHLYTLSLHDALPIFAGLSRQERDGPELQTNQCGHRSQWRHLCCRRLRLQLHQPIQPESAVPSHFWRDRKSTRLNSSHVKISYAVFCLKKKRKKTMTT